MLLAVRIQMPFGPFFSKLTCDILVIYNKLDFSSFQTKFFAIACGWVTTIDIIQKLLHSRIL